jgi:hypothetical protein
VNGRGDLVGCHDSTAGFVSFTVQNFPRIFPAQQPLRSCASSINFARDIVGSFFTLTNTNSFLAVPVLTLLVPSPVYGSTVRNPVRVFAGASGYERVLGIKVSVNSQKIADQAGKIFNQQLILPSGNVRLVIQAFDTKGRVATVIDTITVR